MKGKIGFPLVVFLLVSVLVVCGCSLLSGSASNDTTTQPTTLETMVSAFDAYDLAMAEIAGRYEEVYLYELVTGGTVGLMSFEEKVNDKGEAFSWQVSLNELRAEDEMYVTMIITVENGEVTSTYVGDPNHTDLESFWNWSWVDMEKCSISPSEAVAIADQRVGSDGTRIMLKLCNDHGGLPQWVVAYGPPLGTKGEQEGVSYFIDGRTGEVTGTLSKTYNVF